MASLATLIDTHGVDVLDHLDREVDVPVSTGLQRQGDVLVVPRAVTATTPVPPAGVPVVRGEAGGNTHALVGAGCFLDLHEASASDLTLGTLVVPEGREAYLAHPEHGYLGVGVGTYEIRRQRQLMDEVRLVAD